ncbi:MAG: pectate lyase [Gemmatimonadetes bacterium]|nr:pectate lyase [Gemmatimonadota bacterium]
MKMLDARSRSPLSGLAMLLALFGPALASAEAPAQAVTWNAILAQEPAWYGSVEAVRIADDVLLYQHPNGGWGKNIDMARPLDEAATRRVRVESDTVETLIDNGGTYTQLEFLARVHQRTHLERFREASLRAIDFLLEAEYDRGGWPQYYPLKPGYYTHITYNDGAMIGVMRVLRDVARVVHPYGFVGAARRQRAGAAVDRGLRVILDSQIVVDGEKTAWAAQHDVLDLRPQKARTYELPSLSGMESVGIVRYLMDIEQPTPEIVGAIEGAVRWLERVKLNGIRVENRPDASLPGGRDRVVVADPAAGPMWARFYEIGTNKPMFVGRDGIVRQRLADIEHERRVGYAYLGSWPRELLEKEYPAWRARQGR